MELKDYQTRVLADLASYLDVLDGTPNLAQAFKDYWAGKGVRVGNEGGHAGVALYKNTVPGERRSPFVTSGIRVGTPAMTTRGLGRAESARVGELIATVLRAPQDEAVIGRVRAEVHAICAAFPVYGTASAA
jgi:glycine/serine hydroxymethyltransferase